MKKIKNIITKDKISVPQIDKLKLILIVEYL